MKLSEVKLKKLDGRFLGTVGTAIKENGSTISMIASLFGLGLALYSAFKASDDVHDIHEKYESDVQKMRSEGLETPEKAKELKTTRNIQYILAYKWVLLAGGASAACMILSNCLSGATIAGLTTALALEKDKVAAFVKNGKEMLGEEKFKELEDKSLEDLISKNFFGEEGPQARRVSPYSGHLTIDTDSATIFQINHRDLEEVLIHAKEYCERNHGLSQEKLFEMLGFAEAPTGSNVKWWGPNNPFEAHIGNRAYLGAQLPSIEYKHLPVNAWKAGVPGAKNPNK